MVKEIGINEVDSAISIHLARLNFWEFCLWMDERFFKKRPYLKQLADELHKIKTGEIKALSGCYPPRAGKSYTVTLFCIWWLGHNPTKCVMRNTVTATLYRKFSYHARAFIKGEKYKKVFPGIQLAEDRQNIDCWALKTSTQSAYFGGGVGTNIIGDGANLAITDDLYPGFAEALSKTYNDTVEMWRFGSHDSRQEAGCPVIDIGTRWSLNDNLGTRMAANKYDVSLIVTAIITDNEGNEVSFCEDVKTTAEYKTIRTDLENANKKELWDAEYMQDPAEIGGLLYRKNQIHRFTMEEFFAETKNEKGESIIQCRYGYIDPADGGSDDCAGLWGSIIPKKVFITDVIFTQDRVEVSTVNCAKKIEKTESTHTRIEKNGNGSGYIRDMRRLVEPTKIWEVKQASNMSKEVRIWNESGFIHSYFYFLSESEYVTGSDYDKFMKNLFSYLKGKENQQDGAPDASTGLSRMIQSFPSKVLFQ